MAACCLCGGTAEANHGRLGQLLGPIAGVRRDGNIYVHQQCAIWSPEVYQGDEGHLFNVAAAIKRGRLIKCDHCHQAGATIGCNLERCNVSYHLPCVQAAGATFFTTSFQVACPAHAPGLAQEYHRPAEAVQPDSPLAAHLVTPGGALNSPALASLAAFLQSPAPEHPAHDSNAAGPATCHGAAQLDIGDCSFMALLQTPAGLPGDAVQEGAPQVSAALAAPGNQAEQQAWDKYPEHKAHARAAIARLRHLLKRRRSLLGAEEDDDELQFQRKQHRRYVRDIGRLNPRTFGGPAGACNAPPEQRPPASAAEKAALRRKPTIQPPTASQDGWQAVGGHERVVAMLKEMVILPLVYPDLYSGLGVQAPRGILFHGPPGTGKTLMARALAGALQTASPKPVTFFARKGADCLGKFSGEAERTLRLLFEECMRAALVQAERCAPSIIFLDELDGLAPVRARHSGGGDTIYASVVSTLLSLMDGLVDRGQVIVIGATNRPDAIDPALRRPGRFDREVFMGLPDVSARLRILQVHTRKWPEPVPQPVLHRLAAVTKGYAGADLAALCTAAVMRAVQRLFPKLQDSLDEVLEPLSAAAGSAGSWRAAACHVTAQALPQGTDEQQQQQGDRGSEQSVHEQEQGGGHVNQQSAGAVEGGGLHVAAPGVSGGTTVTKHQHDTQQSEGSGEARQEAGQLADGGQQRLQDRPQSAVAHQQEHVELGMKAQQECETVPSRWNLSPVGVAEQSNRQLRGERQPDSSPVTTEQQTVKAAATLQQAEQLCPQTVATEVVDVAAMITPNPLEAMDLKVKVEVGDWLAALQNAPPPASARGALSALTEPRKGPLPWHLAPLLSPWLLQVLAVLDRSALQLPPAVAAAVAAASGQGVTTNSSSNAANPECRLHQAEFLHPAVWQQAEAALTAQGLVAAAPMHASAITRAGSSMADDVPVHSCAEPTGLAASITADAAVPGQVVAGILLQGEGPSDTSPACVAAAVQHVLQGAETHVLSQAGMIAAGDGALPQGMCRLMQAAKQGAQGLVVLLLPFLEAWATTQLTAASAGPHAETDTPTAPAPTSEPPAAAATAPRTPQSAPVEAAKPPLPALAGTMQAALTGTDSKASCAVGPLRKANGGWVAIPGLAPPCTTEAIERQAATTMPLQHAAATSTAQSCGSRQRSGVEIRDEGQQCRPRDQQLSSKRVGHWVPAGNLQGQAGQVDRPAAVMQIFSSSEGNGWPCSGVDEPGTAMGGGAAGGRRCGTWLMPLPAKTTGTTAVAPVSSHSTWKQCDDEGDSPGNPQLQGQSAAGPAEKNVTRVTMACGGWWVPSGHTPHQQSRYPRLCEPGCPVGQAAPGGNAQQSIPDSTDQQGTVLAAVSAVGREELTGGRARTPISSGLPPDQQASDKLCLASRRLSVLHDPAMAKPDGLSGVSPFRGLTCTVNQPRSHGVAQPSTPSASPSAPDTGMRLHNSSEGSSIVYSASEAWNLFQQLLSSFPPTCQLLLLATTSVQPQRLPQQVVRCFHAVPCPLTSANHPNHGSSTVGTSPAAVPVAPQALQALQQELLHRAALAATQQVLATMPASLPWSSTVNSPGRLPGTIDKSHASCQPAHQGPITTLLQPTMRDSLPLTIEANTGPAARSQQPCSLPLNGWAVEVALNTAELEKGLALHHAVQQSLAQCGRCLLHDRRTWELYSATITADSSAMDKPPSDSLPGVAYAATQGYFHTVDQFHEALQRAWHQLLRKQLGSKMQGRVCGAALLSQTAAVVDDVEGSLAALSSSLQLQNKANQRLMAGVLQHQAQAKAADQPAARKAAPAAPNVRDTAVQQQQQHDASCLAAADKAPLASNHAPAIAAGVVQRHGPLPTGIHGNDAAKTCSYQGNLACVKPRPSSFAATGVEQQQGAGASANQETLDDSASTSKDTPPAASAVLEDIRALWTDQVSSLCMQATSNLWGQASSDAHGVPEPLSTRVATCIAWAAGTVTRQLMQERQGHRPTRRCS